jgi:hypothetical protein
VESDHNDDFEEESIDESVNESVPSEIPLASLKASPDQAKNLKKTEVFSVHSNDFPGNSTVNKGSVVPGVAKTF